MRFFIDKAGLETKETMKRFCYGITAHKEVKAEILFLLNQIRQTDFTGDLGIEHFEVYEAPYCCLVIMDEKPKQDTSSLFNGQKEQITRIENEIGLNKIVLLDRIFKKESKKKYVTKKNHECKSVVMTLELTNDPLLLQEYKDIHRPENIWPQIIQNMNTMGIQDMEIYLHGYRAFLILDADSDFDIEKDGEIWAKLPKEQEWQEYVAKFQKTDPESKAAEKWKIMTVTSIKHLNLIP